MSENNMFLSVRDIVVEYTQNKQVIHAVNGVSLELEKGKTLGLVGETGAGKTTVAKSILRILPDNSARFVRGEVILGGENITALEETRMLDIRGGRIAMIFQDPMTALNPLMSVGEQIMEVFSIHRDDLSKAECDEESARMLELVGIPRQRRFEYPHQFSGGMKQRVVIAMALACDPELLLADEPTTALDVTIQAQVLELIKDLQEKLNTSMILITHDLGVVAETCDSVAVMYAGKIVESGDKWPIFQNPSHPYTIGLFGSLPSMNIEQSRLTPIRGLPPDPSRLPEGCSFARRCPKVTKSCIQNEIPLIEVEPNHLCRCLKFNEGGASNGE